MLQTSMRIICNKYISPFHFIPNVSYVYFTKIIFDQLFEPLKNMVGPGDVDDELEPEVKDECNTKYGDVVKVLIHEAFGTTPEDAVKIFVEFKRMESAIKGKHLTKLYNKMYTMA